MDFTEILNKEHHTKEDIIVLLKAENKNLTALLDKGQEVKKQYVGNITYFRGLIEYSNYCSKNCYYCGIRRDNSHPLRYKMTEKEVLDAVKYAYDENYASLVLQAGELASSKFTQEIYELLKKIGEITHNEMGITLSLGEQDKNTLLKWKKAGAKRYLLRIETSSQKLYQKLHPNDTQHSYQKRLNVLKTLREIGYQAGSGVMIGLPFQTVEDLADDLIFLRDFDIDMVGMGPYIEHSETPLYQYKDTLWSLQQRFDMSIKMIAVLRIMMKDINIAATTALQGIDPSGREKAITAGANVIMPNLTPKKYRKNYLLYEDKPCVDEDADQCKHCLSIRIRLAGDEIGLGKHGDSKHYFNRV
jgi:biotin synthase